VLEKLARVVNRLFRPFLAHASNGLGEVLRWRREFGLNEPQVRGLRLLKDWLSPEQLAQYDIHNYFDVVGCHTGRTYRIRHGTSANIVELNSAGRPLVGWCFIPRDDLVAGDVMLAQKIALETDESAALNVAKRFSPTWLSQ
jgi:hypothetical protein